MRPRFLLIGSLIVAACVVGYTVLSPAGLAKMERQRAEARALRRDVAALKGKNAALAAEVRLLQGEAPGSDAYLEDVIRQELGYIRADEHLLLFDAPAVGTAVHPVGGGASEPEESR